MGKPEFHQRRYLVDKRFQIKYTLYVTFISSIIFCVLGYLLYQTSVANTQILQIQNMDLQNMVSNQDQKVFYLLLSVFVLQIGSLFVLGILITHRIAGPMYRVQRYLEEVAESGELKSLSPIRERDEFSNFFDSLGKVIDKIRSSSDLKKSKINDLKTALEKQDFESAKKIGSELSSLF